MSRGLKVSLSSVDLGAVASFITVSSIRMSRMEMCTTPSVCSSSLLLVALPPDDPVTGTHRSWSARFASLLMLVAMWPLLFASSEPSRVIWTLLKRFPGFS